MLITIPLSKFSKKIILKNYGTKTPIRIEPGTPFYANVFLRSKGNAAITHALEKELTESLTFDIPENPLFSTHQVRLRIGDHVNSYHRRELNQYIRKREAAGVQNVAAVDEFCKAHNIDLDIDITFDAVIRDYRRKKSNNFIEKNTDFFATKYIVTGRQKWNTFKIEIPDFSMLSDSELDSIIDSYITNNISIFQRKKDKRDLKLMKVKLIAFVYRYCAKRATKKCLEKVNAQNVNYRTFWRYANSFKEYYPTLPPLTV